MNTVFLAKRRFVAKRIIVDRWLSCVTRDGSPDSSAKYYAHRLAERLDKNDARAVQVVDAVVHRDDTALDGRITRARVLQWTMLYLDATSVEDLEAYRKRQNSLHNSLTTLGGVNRLHAKIVEE